MLKFHQALAARRRALANGEKSDEGFTLIELLIVVLIIGVLAAIAIPVYLSTVGNTKKTTGQQTVSQLATSVTAWSSQNGGKLPSSLSAPSPAGVGTTDADLAKSLPAAGADIQVSYGADASGNYCVVATYKSQDGSSWYSTNGSSPKPVTPDSTNPANDATPAKTAAITTLPSGCTTGITLAAQNG